MPYMLMIMEPRGQRSSVPEAQSHVAYAQMLEFADQLKARGVLRGVESLQSDDQAVRVQNRDGKRSLVDGPFSEAKEMIGGFFLIDCETVDQAIAIAGECPACEWATVEVRETGPCYL